ncbi:MAG: NAD-dependent epimerase/dehydratase family protein [Bacteroidetes bacterium]|nr:NAD-dependent epimerase/dehydratase family protein [Bacteroidota bacterium]
MRNVLITGVAGFIGSNLLDYLLKETDWNIDGIDNLSTGRLNNIEHVKDVRFKFINDSVMSLSSLRKYSAVFHLAALPRIQPSFELIIEHINANLICTMHLIEIMIKENHYPKLIYSSSSAIYGTPENYPTNENESAKSLSPYAYQKEEVEKYLKLLETRYPIDYVNLRYFNPYGPRSFNPENKFNAYSSVVGIFLYRKKNGMPLLVTGDGSQRRDFIHVYDVARANYMASLKKERINSSFNIGHGSTLSVIDLAKMISNEIEFIPKREGESEITYADITKAKEYLDWSPKFELVDFINDELNN